MNYSFSHIPSDQWTDPAKKDEYDALGRENAKLRGQIAELEKKDLNDPAINIKENLIATNQQLMDKLDNRYGPGRPQLQAPAPAAQPGKFFPFIILFFFWGVMTWNFFSDDSLFFIPPNIFFISFYFILFFLIFVFSCKVLINLLPMLPTSL